MKCKNTLQKGKMRYIIFRDKKDKKDIWYGVGLEFNIVESGDTPREAMLLLFEAVTGYVESAQKIKARPHILNQKSDREYEEMWEYLEQNKEVPTGEVFSFGNLNIRKGVSIPV